MLPKTKSSSALNTSRGGVSKLLLSEPVVCISLSVCQCPGSGQRLVSNKALLMYFMHGKLIWINLFADLNYYFFLTVLQICEICFPCGKAA